MTNIIAHRGASKIAPENTLSAFRKALEIGSHGIELDVHVSRDGELIVCHDERVDRTTDGMGLIKDLTLSDLKQLDAGGWFSPEHVGEQVPTLREVLELVKNRKLLLNVELKTNVYQYDGIEQAVLSLLDEYSYIDNTIISSFNHYTLARVKEMNSIIRVGILYVAILYQPWRYAKTLSADVIHPHYKSIAATTVTDAQDKRLMVNVWTVDDQIEMKSFIEQGVDGLITNYPDKALEIVKA